MQLLDTRAARVKVVHRPPDSWMGRFGGGWQWKIGVQASKGWRTVLISLLVVEVIVERPIPPLP